MSIQGEIDRLSAAKTAIASALETMGIEPPEGTTLDQYAAQLTAIAASAPWLDKSTYDPQNKAQDVFGYVDSVAEGLIEYVDFTVTEEMLDYGYRAVSNKTFEEVVALLDAGTTVIGRVTGADQLGVTANYSLPFLALNEGEPSYIIFGNSLSESSILIHFSVDINSYNESVFYTDVSSSVPRPSYESDNGKVLMAQNGDPAWSPMPTAGELGAVPISGGTMTGPLTLSGDPAEDLQAAPKQYVDALKPKPITITLPASGWSNNQQTVTATGVTADNAVTPSPAPESWEAAGAAGVRCTAQGADSLTFACSETPTEDLTYNVLIQEVQ